MVMLTIITEYITFRSKDTEVLENVKTS